MKAEEKNTILDLLDCYAEELLVRLRENAEAYTAGDLQMVGHEDVEAIRQTCSLLDTIESSQTAMRCLKCQ